MFLLRRAVEGKALLTELRHAIQQELAEYKCGQVKLLESFLSKTLVLVRLVAMLCSKNLTSARVSVFRC